MDFSLGKIKKMKIMKKKIMMMNIMIKSERL